MDVTIRDLNESNIDILEVNAQDIADLSGQNRVQGIHAVKKGNEIIAAMVLCTINGKKYANQWLANEEVLKYYCYGITQKGVKKFDPSYKFNQIIFNSEDNYPVYAFVRNDEKDKYVFKGDFELIGDNIESNGDMYFLLRSKLAQGNPSELANISIEDNENFPEGKVKERLHKYKERNSRLVKEAKQKFIEKHGALYCEVCSFDFNVKYGVLGEGFIEAHHDKPVSQLSENEHTNIKDIRMLCSNCHKMIHRKRPWLNVEELKEMLSK